MRMTITIGLFALLRCVILQGSPSEPSPPSKVISSLNLRLIEMPANRWLKLHQQKPGDRVHFSRQQHGGSCFDTKRGRLILFGSNTHGKNWYNSPFVFDPAEETWNQLHPHDPRDTYAVNKSGIGVAGPRGDHPWAMHTFGALLYDVARDEIVVASHPGHMVPGRFTDAVAELWADVKKFPTWTFDLESEKWRPLACDAVSFFPYCAAYDLQKHVILGHKPDGIFQLGGKPRVWEQRTQHVFLDGWHTNAVYDAGEQALVVFGTNTNSNEIEVFLPATGKHRLMPTPGRRPPKDQHNPMAYVPELGQTVVVVDRTVETVEVGDQKSQHVAEVWLYNLSADSWTPIPEATLPFACGMNYHMQYDPFHKCLLLVTGSRTPKVGPATGETTVWALRIELP